MERCKLFAITYHVRKITAKKSCRYGEYGSFEQLLFLYIVLFCFVFSLFGWGFLGWGGGGEGGGMGVDPHE